tara:strand:- start:7322 stop:8071 length:750 start_codon:yes stop_codon:yes gene_type:complete
MKKNIAILIYVLSFLLLISCTKIHRHAEKSSIPEKEPRKERVYFTYGLKSKKGSESGDEYIVKKGDTLYSISLIYDVNYIKIAKWNNIRSPYKLRVGDRIIIKSNKFRKEETSDEKYKEIKKKVKYASNVKWSRPHNGKISKEFSYSDIGKKGIDISGKIGDDIFSSSDGMVVYTGNGIKGYGNLIIIKHNETFLSAYAHTSKILVEENNLVKKGQVIAKLGDTDSIKPILHFQIRKNGKPVDPIKYLP